MQDTSSLVSRSDINFDERASESECFDSDDSRDGDDVSIATNSSVSVSIASHDNDNDNDGPNNGRHDVGMDALVAETFKFVGLDDAGANAKANGNGKHLHPNNDNDNAGSSNSYCDEDDEESDFLRDIGGGNASDSDGSSCASIGDDDDDSQQQQKQQHEHEHQELSPVLEGDQKRRRGSSSLLFKSPTTVSPMPETTATKGRQQNQSDDETSPRRSASFHRRPPPRTKSGDGGTGRRTTPLRSGSHCSSSINMRPPPRTTTKSGEKMAIIPGPPLMPARSSEHRTPPYRTKSGAYARALQQRGSLLSHSSTNSGEGLKPGRHRGATTVNGNGNGNADSHQITNNHARGTGGDDKNRLKPKDYIVMMPSFDDDVDDSDIEDSVVDSVPSPVPRHRRHGSDGSDAVYREMALERNSARRQKSSDMLGAMRQATRSMQRHHPVQGAGSDNNTLSTAPVGRRAPPGRSKSESMGGSCNNNGGGLFAAQPSDSRKPIRRKPPPRAKFGDGVEVRENTTLSELSEATPTKVSL